MDTSKITKTIVVTGSYKGIGYGIVRSVLSSPNYQDTRVILTARNVELGKKVTEDLQKEFSSFNAANRVFFHQLDINDPKSQDELFSFLNNTYKTINILVNNAGVCLPKEIDR